MQHPSLETKSSQGNAIVQLQCIIPQELFFSTLCKKGRKILPGRTQASYLEEFRRIERGALFLKPNLAGFSSPFPKPNVRKQDTKPLYKKNVNILVCKEVLLLLERISHSRINYIQNTAFMGGIGPLKYPRVGYQDVEVLETSSEKPLVET